ncbi:MAG: CRISPR-associated helicase Cas3' [Sphaerospermopsis kisseleviana]
MKYLSRVNKNGLKQELKQHLTNVATMSRSIVPSEFQAVAYYAGLWHDLGKYRKEWQNYLLHRVAGDKLQTIPHAVHGAVLALQSHNSKKDPPAMAYIIAGHHAGLYSKDKLKGTEYKQKADGLGECLPNAKNEIPGFMPDKLPDIDLPKLSREFAIRMIFSVVVDSDRTDAQIFESGKLTQIKDIIPNFPTFSHTSDIGLIRSEFAKYCISVAEYDKGFFRLTGACGVGKTVSSAKFAYLHSIKHDMSGIVYVSPLKSIIEQTANVYRQLFGEDTVLEHHSGYDPSEAKTEEYKLNTERWDKPVIVTSGVEFYESLFANSPSKCRKLQSLINKVILIDESQTIPTNLIRPTLDVLKCLVKDWGCTVVLMSATQPAFTNLKEDDLKGVTDIVPYADCVNFFDKLNRVNYQFNSDLWEIENLRNNILEAKINQGLVIVNTTKLARDVYQDLSDYVPCYHLSSRMCAEHRHVTLSTVKKLLAEGKPCFLISTQVIEAGVDIDFPQVWRQLAPLDSIIQAAGRCNREGNKDRGDVIIFKMKGFVSLDYTNRQKITEHLLMQTDLNANILDTVNRYFRILYNENHDGGLEIQKLRENYNYPEVAEKYKVLEDSQISVVVEYANNSGVINDIKNKEFLTNNDWRKLQKYTINVPQSMVDFEEINGVKYWIGEYDQNVGCLSFEHKK